MTVPLFPVLIGSLPVSLPGTLRVTVMQPCWLDRSAQACGMAGNACIPRCMRCLHGDQCLAATRCISRASPSAPPDDAVALLRQACGELAGSRLINLAGSVQGGVRESAAAAAGWEIRPESGIAGLRSSPAPDEGLVASLPVHAPLRYR